MITHLTYGNNTAMVEREDGQTMTEYALILAAIAIVAIVAYTTLGTTIVTLVNKVIACL
jgi:Flp pilus assembly pilin Flp